MAAKEKNREQLTKSFGFRLLDMEIQNAVRTSRLTPAETPEELSYRDISRVYRKLEGSIVDVKMVNWDWLRRRIFQVLRSKDQPLTTGCEFRIKDVQIYDAYILAYDEIEHIDAPTDLDLYRVWSMLKIPNSDMLSWNWLRNRWVQLRKQGFLPKKTNKGNGR